MSSPKTYFLKFSHKRKEAEDVYSFFFEKRENNINFFPGQYMRVFLDIKNPDERGSARYFTISGSPLDKKYISITTRIIKSSFKKNLFKLKKEKEVKFFGPIGTFILDRDKKTEKVFLSGGIGITPFRSSIKYFFERKKHPKITLLASFSSDQDKVFYDELSEVAEKDSNFTVAYKVGRFDKKLILNYVGNLSNKKFYVVGPPKMVGGIYKILKSIDIAEENIFKEDFTGY